MQNQSAATLSIDLFVFLIKDLIVGDTQQQILHLIHGLFSVFLQCRIMSTHKRILRTLGNGPARRNLFGPVDREQLQADYQAILRKDLEEASTRWGFDFRLDKPLESSNFQWEGIPSAKVPLLYRSCMFGLGQEKDQRVTEAAVTPKRRRVEPPPRREKENIPCSPERCELDLEKTPEKGENTGLKRKQTNITGKHSDISSISV